jgi:hypothetical protein
MRLLIARAIIEARGGTLSLIGQRDRGSVFSFSTSNLAGREIYEHRHDSRC